MNPGGPTREQVMAAMLAAASAAANFKTVSRRVVLAPSSAGTPVPATPALQPALYLLEDNEQTIQKTHGAPWKRLWRVQLWVWAQIPNGATPGVPDVTIPGGAVINPLLESIETVFQPDSVEYGVFTLGGLVERCWIEGTTVKITGDLNPDGQCLAIVPVSILVP